MNGRLSIFTCQVRLKSPLFSTHWLCNARRTTRSSHDKNHDVTSYFVFDSALLKAALAVGSPLLTLISYRTISQVRGPPPPFVCPPVDVLHQLFCFAAKMCCNYFFKCVANYPRSSLEGLIRLKTTPAPETHHIFAINATNFTSLPVAYRLLQYLLTHKSTDSYRNNALPHVSALCPPGPGRLCGCKTPRRVLYAFPHEQHDYACRWQHWPEDASDAQAFVHACQPS